MVKFHLMFISWSLEKHFIKLLKNMRQAGTSDSAYFFVKSRKATILLQPFTARLLK